MTPWNLGAGLLPDPKCGRPRTYFLSNSEGPGDVFLAQARVIIGKSAHGVARVTSKLLLAAVLSLV